MSNQEIDELIENQVRLRKAILNQLKGLDVALVYSLQATEDNRNITKSQDSAVRALQHLNVSCTASNREPAWAALMQAQRALVGDDISSVQREKRLNTRSWYVQPLIDMVKLIRRKNYYMPYTDIYHYLSCDCYLPDEFESVEINEYDAIEIRNKTGKIKVLDLEQLGNFMTNHRKELFASNL